MTEPTFTNLLPTDRVNHERKEVITSGGYRVPPVPTTFWEPKEWATWDANTARVMALTEEATAAGYRVVRI